MFFRNRHREEDLALARGLGMASIGIELAELAAPRQLERMLGIGDGEHAGILRAMGVRELMHGIDILAHEDPTPGIWSRVVGDVLDGVLLGVAARKTEKPAMFGTASLMVLGIAAVDAIAAQRLARKRSFWS